MKKKLLALTCTLLFGLSTVVNVVKAGEEKGLSLSETNQTIYEAVKNELSSFLEIIPNSMEKDHGFNNRSEFAKALPGSIYRMVGVDPDGHLFQTNFFSVVITVNGENRAVLTVSFKDGNYEIEAIGATLLAKELQAVEKANPLASNEERIIVNVYSKSASFVANQTINASVENANLIPLASAKEAITETGSSTLTTYKLSEALQAMESN